MRLKLYEDAIRAKAQKKKGRRNSRGSPTPQDEPTDADAEAESPGVNGGGDIALMVEAMSQASPSNAGSRSKHSVASHGTKGDSDPLDELTASATQAKTEMVQKFLEGLREEAFELARDNALRGIRTYSSSELQYCIQPKTTCHCTARYHAAAAYTTTKQCGRAP